ncbi:fumarylacetoacetate hydrolase domain-containing protein 2A [Musca domestica]|uniref:Fumarylacetoacetate hydrolase domain-containing protein 2A n=1 Tax=Musca domestica TaxID=7370 RepID=A0A1I8MQA1_MUSDO|nr:fumarylacetoacetate hydrolase domain-containing protein 2A [Musca domestica]XP_019892570.1 fumarylacetoacetate hydrolase domain-containing protein 2A [Musca domestica]
MGSLRVFGVILRQHMHRSLPTFGCMRYYSCETKQAPKMRFVQFLRKNDERQRLGVVSEDGTSLVELSSGSCVSNDMVAFIKQNYSISELEDKLKNFQSEEMNDSITLLPPVTNPEKIICIGLNYQDHCEEQNKEPPKEPMFFSKYNNTLVGPRGNVIAHQITDKIDWEIELAVIIGKKCKDVSREHALDHVFGYSVAQDISARDWQKQRNGGQFLIGKSMDTFLPIGPSIVHKSLIKDPHDLEMVCKINGVEKQHGNTNNMIYKIDDIISRLSQSITLQPGDIILTGTPKGVGMHRNPPEYLKPGDVIESEIQCLGKLVNKVVAP